MENTNSLSPKVKKDIPDTSQGRIAELMQLSYNDKKAFIPPVGFELQLGPFKFKVSFTNIGELRFTAKLSDVIIDGVNDDKSSIISPHTGKEIVT